jgi:3D (Asp-Asp-Asp) domain-containing protein
MMTNNEKFIKVFGFHPNIDDCPMPVIECAKHENCWNCEHHHFWVKEYKSPFRKCLEHMRKRIKNTILVILIAVSACYLRADAKEIPDGCELLRCTCYTPTGNKTATGIWPYEGICASNRAHLGMVAVLYTQDMEFIGYFVCKDTGGHEGLKNGTRIDIYRDNMDGVRKWQNTVGDYVIVQWVKGEG